jgi:hypothetical protein
VSRGTSALIPKDMMIDGPRIMRDLMRMVQASDARGVLLHLDNHENLSESDAERAAEVLRALRDLMLLHNGLHYIIAGTTDAVNIAINTHAQVRSVVTALIRTRLLGEGAAILGVQPLHAVSGELGRRPQRCILTTPRQPRPTRLVRRDWSEHLFPERDRRRGTTDLGTLRRLRQPAASYAAPRDDEQLTVGHRIASRLQPDDAERNRTPLHDPAVERSADVERFERLRGLNLGEATRQLVVQAIELSPASRRSAW